ncbi:MAG: 3-oxoacyl-[acyl-carrier-protein] synthase III C-terminal domain-containing protein [Alphaproteobacteria bacterium]
MPGAPIHNSDMENYLGQIGGKPSKYKSLVLRQNKIKTRHYALDKNGHLLFSSAEMAALAIQDAIKKSEINADNIQYLAASATLGDVLVPGLASHIHAILGIPPIEIANFQSVCASALMALKSAYTQLKCGEHRCATVSGSEFASRYFRPGFYEHTTQFQQAGEIDFAADFLRFTLSDGAGAAILETRPNTRQLSLKIHWIDIRSYADRFDICMVGGGAKEHGDWQYWSNYASPIEAVQAGALMLRQDFELMKQMIPVWIAHYLDLIDMGKITIATIDHVCSHYSSHSLRLEAITLLKKAGAMIDEEKWFSNLASKGNTGTASIFIILEELYHSGRLQKGETILCQVPESGRAVSGFMLLEVV